jgi:hypothetical protein
MGFVVGFARAATVYSVIGLSLGAVAQGPQPGGPAYPQRVRSVPAPSPQVQPAPPPSAPASAPVSVEPQAVVDTISLARLHKMAGVLVQLVGREFATLQVIDLETYYLKPEGQGFGVKPMLKAKADETQQRGVKAELDATYALQGAANKLLRASAAAADYSRKHNGPDWPDVVQGDAKVGELVEVLPEINKLNIVYTNTLRAYTKEVRAAATQPNANVDLINQCNLLEWQLHWSDMLVKDIALIYDQKKNNIAPTFPLDYWQNFFIFTGAPENTR